MSMSFPNETPEYRAARDALLASEMALRRQMEAVAAQLRGLPRGGEVPEDYRFDAIGAGGAATVIRMCAVNSAAGCRHSTCTYRSAPRSEIY